MEKEKNTYQNESETEGIYLKDLIYSFLAYWKYFALSLAVCLFLAFAYLHYTMPTYRVSSKIMIRDEKRGGDFFSEMSVFDNIDMLYKANTENEVELLMSKTLIKNVIQEKNLYMNYFCKSFLRCRDVTGSSPVVVVVDSLFDLYSLPSAMVADLEMHNNNSVRLSLACDQEVLHDSLYAGFPIEVNTPYGLLSFAQSQPWGEDAEYDNICIEINSPISLAKRYIKNLHISQISKNSSVVVLTLNTTNKKQGVVFLDGLIDMYNRSAIEEKNEVATKTALFIDNRISVLTDELGETEKNLERYKKREGLTELSSNAELYLQKGAEYEQKRVECETQLNLVLSLKSYLEDEANKGSVIPSNIGLNDAGLMEQINQYNNLLLSRVKLLQTTSENNPVVVQQSLQINGLFENIKLLVSSVEKSLNISLSDLNRQTNKFKGQISNVPTQERLFVEIERQRQIQQQLFLLLLQKREENALTMAATMNCAKVVEESMADDIPISPRMPLVLFLAVVLGLFIPTVSLYLRKLFSFNVTDSYCLEQEKLTTLPVLAELPFKDSDISDEEWQMVREEPFRLLRTNLQFVSADKNSKVILVTSFVPNEGKTFVTVNTAMSFASLSKKVVIVGADIRNPQINRYFTTKKKYGLSNYLSNDSLKTEDILEQSDVPNLDVISCGSIPPNPTELLSCPRLESLFEELRNRYDYVLIDTAPVSVVTDTLVLARVADLTAFVCRSRFLNKRSFKYINTLADEKRLPNVGIVINAVKKSRRNRYSKNSGYGYNGGYGYGYSYGYGQSKKHSSK